MAALRRDGDDDPHRRAEIPVIRPRIKKLFRLAFHRREDAERDVRDEIRLHVELRTKQLIGGGMAPDEARREAERKFGSIDAVRPMLDDAATHRETVMRKREWWESFTQDLRYVLRSLKRSPTFTVSATLTLALGLGANVALFTVLDRLYLQAPSGVSAPNQLRRVYSTATFAGIGRGLRAAFAPPEWSSIVEAAPAADTVTGYRTQLQAALANTSDAPTGNVTWILGDYFGTLGVHPVAGRNFTADETRVSGFAAVAIITNELARDRFGSASGAIGQPLDLGTHRYTIIGVAPMEFRGTELDASDVWVPMNTQVSWVTRDTSWVRETHSGMIHVIARTHGDASVAALAGRATPAIRHVTAFSDTASMIVVLGSIKEMLTPGSNVSEQAITTRLAAVALAILFIACANVANLLLARALQRRREIGVRLALGIARARLVRQLVTESVVLALCGGAGALVASVWTATALRNILMPGVHWAAPAVGWRAVGFAIGAATIAGFCAGLVPALSASRPDLSRVLTGGARDGVRHRSFVRTGLLMSQVALSCVLLAGGGLFIRSLKQVEAIDTGYSADRLVFAGYNYSRESAHTPDEAARLLAEAATRLAAMPGIERVAFAQNAPMLGSISFMPAFLQNGDSLPHLSDRMTTVSFISPGAFATIGMRMLMGRDFSSDDRESSEPVIVVNATFARTVWPTVSPVGQCVIVGKIGDPCRRVVGVVSNARQNSVIESPSMMYYVPLAQQGFGGTPSLGETLEIRAAPGRTAQAAADVRRILVQLAPAGMRPTLRIFSEQISSQTRPWRVGAALFTASALLALLVAAVGIYGTIAYTVSQRTQEIGVRIALGAQGSSIIALVLKSSVTIAAVGVVIGTGVALWAGKFAKPLLYDTAPNNPFVLGGVALVLLGVAVVASLVPAIRAKSVDPLEALRAE